MTGAELEIALRELLDDEAEPQQWTTPFLIGALNRAQEQVTRRAHVLKDANTASVCVISLLSSVASYPLHSKIIRVERVFIGSADTKLDPITREQLDHEHSGWQSVEGVPQFYVREANQEIVFAPVPQSAMTASLVVTRKPLGRFSTGANESPEIDEEYHYGLTNWALGEAYRKNDSDTMNLDLAEYHEKKFIAEFGDLPTANMQRKIKENNPIRNFTARSKGFGLG